MTTLPTVDKPTYAVDSKAWLKRTLAHPLLTNADKVFCAALYFYFNCKHYRQTGELIAWPSWGTLIAEFGLSKTTISESIEQLERFRLLDVERGRYNRATLKRAGNRYRVPPKFAAASTTQGSYFEPCQGSYFGPDQGSDFGQDSYDSPSPLGERIDSVKESPSPPGDSVREEGLPRETRKESKQERREDLPSSDSPSKDTEFVPRAGGVPRGPGHDPVAAARARVAAYNANGRFR